MPAEGAACEPSATSIAWNWVIEELADCKEFDTSILAALVRWDRSIIADSFYGESARRRLALRFLEELVDSTEPEGLNIINGFVNKSNINVLRQGIQQRRDALPKSSLDLLKHTILKEVIGRDGGIASKRLKLDSSADQQANDDQLQVTVDSGSNRAKNIAPNFSSDDEVSVDLRPKVQKLYAEKFTFLGSQNIFNDGSQAQQRSCIKCDEGGEVLTCMGSGCPITVHPSCLGSYSWLDDPEDFKCPFCSYLQAASDYNKARKKVSSARKALSVFLGWGQAEGKRVNQSKNIAIDTSNKKTWEQADKSGHKEELIDQKQADNSSKEVDNWFKAGDDGSKEVDNGTKETASSSMPKGCEARDMRGSSSSRTKRHRMASTRPKRYANPIIPCGRRNRLAWTDEEEAILKEAMQKFHQSDETRNAEISWVKIWEYGRHVFHRTRQPMDLKDKWRNIKLRGG